MTDAYRSYLIRVRRRLDLPDAIRLELEDLIGGRRAALSGDEAEMLAERLLAVLREPAAGGPPGSVASSDVATRDH